MDGNALPSSSERVPGRLLTMDGQVELDHLLWWELTLLETVAESALQDLELVVLAHDGGSVPAASFAGSVLQDSHVWPLFHAGPAVMASTSSWVNEICRRTLYLSQLDLDADRPGYSLRCLDLSALCCPEAWVYHLATQLERIPRQNDDTDDDDHNKDGEREKVHRGTAMATATTSSSSSSPSLHDGRLPERDQITLMPGDSPPIRAYLSSFTSPESITEADASGTGFEYTTRHVLFLYGVGAVGAAWDSVDRQLLAHPTGGGLPLIAIGRTSQSKLTRLEGLVDPLAERTTSLSTFVALGRAHRVRSRLAQVDPDSIRAKWFRAVLKSERLHVKRNTHVTIKE